jgi:hypothetical protein
LDDHLRVTRVRLGSGRRGATRARVLVVVLLAAVTAAACSAATPSKTTIPRSERVAGYEGMAFESLFVIGVGEDNEARKLFEDAFSDALATSGARAQPSWGLLPQSTLLTEQELEAAVGTDDFDGVLITRLVSVDEEHEYVEGRTYSERHPRYRYYKGYYKGSYKVVHEPGYYETKTTYRLETNLYAVSDGSLVWSADSNTVDPDSVDEGIDSMTLAIVAKLEEEGLIR